MSKCLKCLKYKSVLRKCDSIERFYKNRHFRHLGIYVDMRKNMQEIMNGVVKPKIN